MYCLRPQNEQGRLTINGMYFQVYELNYYMALLPCVGVE